MEKSVFISYAHKDTVPARVKGFVQFLHDCLPQKINILLDRRFLKIGKTIPNFVHKLNKCPVVIVLMTPEYRRRIDSAAGGVFVEYEIIRERLNDEEDDLVCLPVLFEGTHDNSVPELFFDDIYENFTRFHPRFEQDEPDKYYLNEDARSTFIPKFKDIALAVESTIKVRATYLEDDKISNLMETFFANTKITRSVIQLHPELYNHFFVHTRSYKRIRDQNAIFIIGRKGSGKSTIANTLPILEHKKYKTAVRILADHINLLSTVEMIDMQNLSNFKRELTKDQLDIIAEFLTFHPIIILFKYAWLGVIYICLINELKKLIDQNELNVKQQKYASKLDKEYSKFTFHQADSKKNYSGYFTHSCVVFSEFWDNIIIEAFEQNSYSNISRYLEASFNEENYLRTLLGEELLQATRDIVSQCDMRALITLDDFDSIFSVFRQQTRKPSWDIKSFGFSDKSVETSWMQSLMLLVLELKGYRTGWRDDLFNKLDFCITIPKDSFAQVLYEDRDAFLNVERSADVIWTGIYLAEMLLRRISYIYGEDVDMTKNKISELNRIIRTYVKTLPTSLTFDFNDEKVTIDLFSYVLRHTFWRPRGVLNYFAALLHAASLVPSQERLSVDEVRAIVGLRTKSVLKPEFFGEFKGVISNLESIVKLFRKCPQVFSYEFLERILANQEIIVGMRTIENDFNEKIKILYEIGFLGLQLSAEIAEVENLRTTECFYFNEGEAILETMMEFDFEDCKFIIHPIFSEYLRLNSKDNSFILNWDSKYLKTNHSVRDIMIDAV